MQPEPRNPLWWMELASCKDMDRDTFLRPTGNRTKTALAVCAQCPCEQTCLYYGLSLESYDRFGIFGNRTPVQRAALGIPQEVALAVYHVERAELWEAHTSVMERFAI